MAEIIAIAMMAVSFILLGYAFFVFLLPDLRREAEADAQLIRSLEAEKCREPTTAAPAH